MNINYYNNEVDRILWDVLGDQGFIEDDLDQNVELVTTTILQYHDVSESKLRSIVKFLIMQKYQKYYFYNNDSIYNQCQEIINEPDEFGLEEKDFNVASERGSKNGVEYINSELDNVDRVRYSCAADLVSHRHDYEGDEYREAVYINRRKRVAKIKQIPQYEQKSTSG